jgi:hypothetical protein
MIVLLGIDSLGGLQLQSQLSHLPHLKGLVDSGVHTMRARADVRAISSVNWGAHFYGQGAAYHGWYRNHRSPVVQGAQSVFDVVPNSTGCTAWHDLSRVIPAFTYCTDPVDTDAAVTSCAVQAVSQRQHELVAVVWDNVDVAAHNGLDIKPTLRVLDARIGQVLAHITPQDHVLVVSDHGHRTCPWYNWMCRPHYGAYRTEVETPFILKGPSVTRTGPIGRPITHSVTSRVILNVLGKPLPCDWRLGEWDTCNSTWPGMSQGEVLEEDDLRDAINVIINSFIVVVFLILACMCLRRSRSVHVGAPDIRYMHHRRAVRRTPWGVKPMLQL